MLLLAAATNSVHTQEQILTVTLDLSVQACKLMLHGACCMQCRVERVQPATHIVIALALTALYYLA